MGLVYLFGGIAKFDPDWLDGRVAAKLVGAANRGTILEPLMKYDWISLFYIPILTAFLSKNLKFCQNSLVCPTLSVIT